MPYRRASPFSAGMQDGWYRFSAAWRLRDARIHSHFQPFRPSVELLRLLCPLLTSPPRSRALPPAQSCNPDTSRSPEVRPTAFAARPPDLPPQPLMAGLRDRRLAHPIGQAPYPVLVHRAATLLHASFRPRLATTPLRNPSPPSGWIKDFHLQAVDMLGTQKKPRRSGARYRVRMRTRGHAYDEWNLPDASTDVVKGTCIIPEYSSGRSARTKRAPRGRAG